MIERTDGEVIYHEEPPVWRRRIGCCGGCLFIPLAILTTLILTTVAIGGGCAIKAGDYKAVAGGAFGNKDLIRETMPWYAQGIIGRNDSLINDTTQANIGSLEWIQTLGIGKYIISPDSDFVINFASK